MDARNPDRFPPSQLDVLVTAKQFEWNVTYPGTDGQLGTADDFTERNQMRVPVDRTVHVTLAAEDVIHSFFLPSLRVKQDAVPGMTIPVWFEATKAGSYVLGCAELCGLGHYRMRGTVHVLAEAEFDSWYGEKALAAAPAPDDVAVAAASADLHTGH
jgi:cytochrome c oxidase subunit 2